MKEVSVTEFNTDEIVRDKLLTEIINKFEKKINNVNKNY